MRDVVNKIFLDVFLAITMHSFGKKRNFLENFAPTLFEIFIHNLGYAGINNNPKIENTKTSVKKIVTLNIERSRPRRVVYNSPDAPKPAPREAPRCCKRTNKIHKTAETRVTVSKRFPIFIY